MNRPNGWKWNSSNSAFSLSTFPAFAALSTNNWNDRGSSVAEAILASNVLEKQRRLVTRSAIVMDVY
jgi:hypothetical protein